MLTYDFLKETIRAAPTRNTLAILLTVVEMALERCAITKEQFDELRLAVEERLRRLHGLQ